VRQALKVDLDGDGRKDLLIHADAPSKRCGKGKPCRFSAVLVRAQGKTLPIVWSTDKGDRRADTRKRGTLMLTYRIGALADLDGDSRFEIVIEQDYQEGGGGVVAQLWRSKVRIRVNYVAGM
jgi:hypothetical protein